MNTYHATINNVIALIPKTPDEQRIAGGIHLPDNFDRRRLDKLAIAELIVHSVGPDCQVVKVGDRCLYNKHNYEPIPCEDGELLIIPEASILAVFQAERPKAVADGVPLPTPQKPLTVETIRTALKNDGVVPTEPPDAVVEKAAT